MTERNDDDKAWAEMVAGLKDVEEALERVVETDRVAVLVRMSTGAVVSLIRARASLGVEDVRAVPALVPLLTLVDPVLRDAAEQINRRMASE